MPTEMRTKPSVIPSFARCSGGTEACVMVAGCEIKVSTPPRLSANEQSFTRPRKRFAFSNDPTSNEIIAPNPDICFLAISCPGCVGNPG